MLRSLLAALILATTPPVQAVSVKTTVPTYTAAPVIAVQRPPVATGLAPALTPAAIPLLAASVVPSAVQAAAAPVQDARAIVPLQVAAGQLAEGTDAAALPLNGLFDGLVAQGQPAGPTQTDDAVRPIESIKRLKVGSYNLLNLFEHVGSHVPDPQKPGKLIKVSDAKPKPEWALREQGKIILENDFDIMTLAEVENVAALQAFNERYLQGKYNVYLIEGNDQRGIDIAFLVKKDLPFSVAQRSHKEETWVDALFGGKPTTLFSRDLTSLIVRAPGKAAPLFVLFGTHYKSKRDRVGRGSDGRQLIDAESVILRTAQVQRTAKIMQRYVAEFGAGVPMLIGGDFNGDVAQEAAFETLFREAGLTDSFDASPNPPTAKERVTHSYHPRGGVAHYAQMDAVLVSKALRGTVRSAEVYRYRNADGSVRPLPKTYEERELNPSDHYPVIVALDFTPIRTGEFPSWTPAPKPVPKPDESFEEFAYEKIKDTVSPVLRDRTMALARAYMSAAKPERQAAYLLSEAYYDGIESLERAGVSLTPETKRQLETMLVVLDAIVPRGRARRHREPAINTLINTFVPLFEAFDRRDAPVAPRPEPRSIGQDTRAFADGARGWLDASGAAFDAKAAEWTAWTQSPGRVNGYTTRNLPAIRALIATLRAAKIRFAREAAAVPANGELTPEKTRRLYEAWDALRAAANASRIIVADSFDRDLSKRGLIANVDQNEGRHPGGFELFLSPVVSVDWGAARALNGALRANQP